VVHASCQRGDCARGRGVRTHGRRCAGSDRHLRRPDQQGSAAHHGNGRPSHADRRHLGGAIRRSDRAQRSPVYRGIGRGGELT